MEAECSGEEISYKTHATHGVGYVSQTVTVPAGDAHTDTYVTFSLIRRPLRHIYDG